MKKFERAHLAKRVVYFYENSVKCNHKEVINHFKSEGFNRMTIWNISRRYQIEGRIKTPSSKGRRKSKKLKNQKKVEELIENDSEISSRSGAAKLKISKSYFNKIKLHKLNIKSFRKSCS